MIPPTKKDTCSFFFSCSLKETHVSVKALYFITRFYHQLFISDHYVLLYNLHFAICDILQLYHHFRIHSSLSFEFMLVIYVLLKVSPNQEFVNNFTLCSKNLFPFFFILFS